VTIGESDAWLAVAVSVDCGAVVSVDFSAVVVAVVVALVPGKVFANTK
jgi:hypothetical protein